MRIFTAIALCFFSALAVGGQASAQPAPQIITTISPQQVAQILQALGYKASTETEKDGSKFVKTAMSGVTIYVDFPGCTNDNCSSLTFHGIWKDPSLSINFANAYNAAWRYAKTYLDDGGYFHLTYDVNLAGGSTADNIKQNAGLFDYLTGQLLKFPNK